MTRIGILGINDLTEIFLVEFFRREPHAHVFLSAEDNERANLLARKFPCWVQDNGQSVVDEADIVLISHENIRSENIVYQQTQLVLLLEVIPSFNNQNILPSTEQVIKRCVALHNISPCFQLTDEQIDNYLFVLRVQLMSMKHIHSLEINIQTTSELATL